MFKLTFFFLSLTCLLFAEQWEFSYANNTKLEAVEDLSTADPQLLVYSFPRLRFQFKKVGRLEEFQNAVGKNPELKKYLIKEIESIPNTPYNSNSRALLMEPLADIKAEWSVRLLMGQMISGKPLDLGDLSEEDFIKDGSDDGHFDYRQTPYLAWVSLVLMEIEGSPENKGAGPLAYKEWAEWWDINEHNITNILSGVTEEKKNNEISTVENQNVRDEPTVQPKSRSYTKIALFSISFIAFIIIGLYALNYRKNS